MFHFCTYFDRNYLTKGLSLFISLKRHSHAFKLYVLCMDADTFLIMSELKKDHKELIPITLKEIELWDKGLLTAKGNRSKIEYYFTISPILPLYVTNIFDSIDIITYLDADLFFYSNPSCLYDELGDKSILIIGHRFSQKLKKFEKNGLFNVQYQSFRNDDQGVACLQRWREQCLDWCYDRLEGDRYADQKYLNEWPKRYSKLVISQLIGAGVAPWNVGQYEINIDRGTPFVDKQKVVFYHFHSVRKIFNKVYTSEFGVYKLNKNQKNLELLYRRYLEELEGIYSEFGLSSLRPLAQEIRYNKYRFLLLVKYILKRNLFLKIDG